MRKCMILLSMMLCSIQSASFAGESLQGGSLYATRLQSITIPQYFQEKSPKNPAAKGSSTYVYLSVFCDGKLAWISPQQMVSKNQTRFEWPVTQTSIAALPWEKGNDISVKVFFSDDKVDASAIAGTVGAAGGAGAGALIGGIAAGVFTGGLAAPAGALIGAAIGGGAGMAAGVATGALSANDRIVFEMKCSKEEGFPLDGSFQCVEKSTGEQYTAVVDFRLLEAKSPVSQGGLVLGEKYIVRIRNIHLAQVAALKGGKKIDEAKYYVVLEQGEKKHPFYKDNPESLAAGLTQRTSVVTVLKNTGKETRVYIYRKKWGFDKVVFSSTIAQIDGKSWVFIGEASSDDVNDKSYIEFETFGPLL